MPEKSMSSIETMQSDSNLQQEIQAFNLKQAVFSKPHYTLPEILSAKSEAARQEMAEIFQITEPMPSETAEFLAALQNVILQPSKIKKIFCYLPQIEWDLFQEAVSLPHFCPNFLRPDVYQALQMTGLIELYYHEEKFYLVVPQEIKQIYQELFAEGLLNQREFHRLLNRYAQAAANLYGVISPEDLIDLFNQQNLRQTDFKEALPIWLQFISLEPNYLFWEGYLVNDVMQEDGFAMAEYYLQRTQLIPRYIPAKEEFLSYADRSYCEETLPVLKIRSFLIDRLKAAPDSTGELLEKICFLTRQEVPMQVFFDLLHEYEIITEYEQLQAFVGYLADLQNHSRHWANNGHTPNEMAQKRRKEGDPAKPRPIKALKIGRNDPCPCGSGKKYKQCCGRES